MLDSARRRRVLILCTGNSCRSQMAEGLINARLADSWLARSAGTHPAPAVHPLAVRAMAELAIDISHQRPRPVASVADEPWDLVVTVCDAAREACPVFPGAGEQIHRGFPDPALAEGTEEERMAVYRDVRDRLWAALRDELLRRS